LSPALVLACGVMVALLASRGFFPARLLRRWWGVLRSLVECVVDLGSSKRKPSPTLSSVAMVMTLLNVIFPVRGTFAEFPPLQHRVLRVKTLPSLGK
jgi:hypothetical protein